MSLLRSVGCSIPIRAVLAGMLIVSRIDLLLGATAHGKQLVPPALKGWSLEQLGLKYEAASLLPVPPLHPTRKQYVLFERQGVSEGSMAMYGCMQLPLSGC